VKAAGFEETRPRALYNAGAAHARLGHVDRAFEWLLRAQETGQVNMTAVGMDPDLQALRDDPRWEGFFPSEEELADPFVEDAAAIIHEWRGEAEGDQYGWIARNVGDVDGDGVQDLTTSAPTNDEAGEDAGKIYVYSGRTGELLWSAVGDVPGGQLGLGIEAAGDVDGDGTPDVGAGAPVAGAGKVFIYSGRDGTVIHEIPGEEEGSWFGRRVADLGDVDGDGYGEFLVGAPRAGDQAGKAFVYSGRDAGVLMTLDGEEPGDQFGASGAGQTTDGRTFIVVGAGGAGPNDGGATYVYEGLSPEPAFVIEGGEDARQLGGMFVSVVGDVNRDGTPDVYASDWANDAKGRVTGRIFVHSGADGSRLMTLTGEASGDGFGIGPADAGDVDRDGWDDLVIGAWQHASAAPSGGKVYLYSGRDGSLIRTWTGKVPGETLGFDATGMGDVNGDGTPDLLVTSAWSAVEGTRTGRMYVLSGR
jgi:hypothetical protein